MLGVLYMSDNQEAKVGRASEVSQVRQGSKGKGLIGFVRFYKSSIAVCCRL